MAKQNAPLLSIGNRGLISPKALARVDLDRTRLSAEVFKNFIGKTQGALTLRPGTKYVGASRNDTGANFLEFVASTDDVALLELTKNTLRVWLGEDAHALALLERPAVDTTLSLSDTGWSDTSTGGVLTTGSATDILPAMTAATTSGVTITAENQRHSDLTAAFRVADNNTASGWFSGGYVDRSSYAHTLDIYGDGYIDTSQFKYGSMSGRFGAALTAQINVGDVGTELSFGTGDFVVEAFIRLTSTSAEVIYDGGDGTGAFGKILVVSGKLRYDFNGAIRIISAGSLSTGTWYHVALVRSSGFTKLFLDGVQVGSTYTDANNYTTVADYPTIGGSFANYLDGWIDEVRVSKGTDRGYFSGFTPPTGAHTSDGSTSLLLDFEAALPSWVQIDFGAGNTKAITSYTLRAVDDSSFAANTPKTFTLQYNDVDTGAGWTTVDARSSETSWAVSEKRSYERLDADTGTVEAKRYWRVHVTATESASPEVAVAELELLTAATTGQIFVQSGVIRMNAGAVGGLARYEKRVIVSDTGTEHSLDINVSRGPVVLRVGSTQRDDNYVSEASLATGYHNLAFTPAGNFWVTLQTDANIDRLVSSIAIGDSGTVEVPTPWTANDIDNVRIDQSADVVFVDCASVRPERIERRGTGRSWSVVDYVTRGGPLLTSRSSSAKLSVSDFSGNTTMESDIPFFSSDMTGTLIQMFHEGQSGRWKLGALDAKTDVIEVNGLADTGSATPNENERRLTISVTGTWSGTGTVERSIDGEILGFKTVQPSYITSGNAAGADTGTFSFTIDDADDNLTVHYRLRLSSWSSGVAVVAMTYAGGGTTGIARITSYNTNQSVDVAILSRFSDTGYSDNWQEGQFSEKKGYPTAVALHGGRLTHAKGGSLYLSVSDDYDNFDENTEGDSAPFVKTLGSGPVDSIYYLVSLLRMIVGTAGAEMTLRSSSLDEPVTPSNASVGAFSTQGSANLRAVKMDNRALFVQRSRQRLFMVGAGTGTGSTFGDYEGFELTLLVPDLLVAGIVSIAIQRQPDTRIHCVLADGTVGILTYEPQEEVVAWSLWETDGLVERAMVLPGVEEDAVYYHINRTINGLTKRYLEKWTLESECMGDTGLSWLADCAISITTDTGRTTAIEAPHLGGESVIVWANDTGSVADGRDLSYDTGGVQKTYTLDTGGSGSLGEAVHHMVVGLPYTADWKSTKLAYAAEAGTALTQMKRVAQVGLILHETHNNGLYYGSDSGHLSPLPRETDGVFVDKNKIYSSYDEVAVSMDSTDNPDSRLHLRAKAPRPVTVLAVVPTVQTNERA